MGCLFSRDLARHISPFLSVRANHTHTHMHGLQLIPLLSPSTLPRKQRRVDLMAAEGVEFVTGAHVGKTVNVHDLYEGSDALLLTVGATWPRDLPIPGRELEGIHFAMDFLTPTTKVSCCIRAFLLSFCSGRDINA